MIAFLLATRNAHKTAEFAKILGEEFAVTDLGAHPDLPQIEETGSTFEENALLKALTVSRAVCGLVVADDSGLQVDALEGAPGIYSARFAGEQATDAQNVQLLLDRLRDVPVAQRTARFRCVLAVAREGKRLATFSGNVEGRISDRAFGPGGFGYDPIFIPDGFEETFANLSAETKNAISHRARATEQLRAWLLATER